MTMTVHNYRPRQFHRTTNGENLSSGYRDKVFRKSGSRPPGRTMTTIPLQPRGLRGKNVRNPHLWNKSHHQFSYVARCFMPKVVSYQTTPAWFGLQKKWIFKGWKLMLTAIYRLTTWLGETWKWSHVRIQMQVKHSTSPNLATIAKFDEIVKNGSCIQLSFLNRREDFNSEMPPQNAKSFRMLLRSTGRTDIDKSVQKLWTNLPRNAKFCQFFWAETSTVPMPPLHSSHALHDVSTI